MKWKETKMEDRTVKFETAVLAKEKGFPQNTLRMKEFLSLSKKLTDKHFGDNIKSPTQTTLQTWLREEHSIHVLPSITEHPSGKIYSFYLFHGTKPLKVEFNEDHFCSSFEEAMEIGLFLALQRV